MRVILPLLLTVFSFVSLSAQNLFTVDAGVINSKVNVENLEFLNPSDINNYFISMGMGKRFSDKVELIVDLRYATKGFDMRTGDDQLDIRVYNFDYLSVAPMLHYRPVSFASVFTGFNYSQKLRERSRQAGFNSGNWNSTNTIQNQDVNFLFGLSLHYQFMYFKIMFENGLLDVNNIIYTDQLGNPIPDVSVKNQSLSLGIGFYIFG